MGWLEHYQRRQYLAAAEGAILVEIQGPEVSAEILPERSDGACAFAKLLACIALNGWNLKAEFDWKATVGLLRVGSPIMIVGFGLVAFNSMDRTLILLLLFLVWLLLWLLWRRLLLW